jgi:hypothetical protein
MNAKRAVLLAVVVALAVPVMSQAQACLNKYRHITYYGYDHGSGPRCNAVVYPTGPIIEVGERTVHCDGTVDQSGLVCFDVPPNVYSIDCQDCENDPIDISVKDNDTLPEAPSTQWRPELPVADKDVCPLID